MDIKSLRCSLEFIRENCYNQLRTEVRMVPSDQNPNLFMRGDDGDTQYVINRTVFISSPYKFLDQRALTHGIADLVNNSTNVEETKKDLEAILKLSKSNLALIGRVHPLHMTKDGSYHPDGFSFQSTPVINREMFVCVDEDLTYWYTSSQSFKTSTKEYKRPYSLADYYYFCQDLCMRIDEKIGDWIIEKKQKQEKSGLEIKKLNKEVYFFKDIRWWFGVFSGAITTAGSLVTIYFTYLKK